MGCHPAGTSWVRSRAMFEAVESASAGLGGSGIPPGGRRHQRDTLIYAPPFALVEQVKTMLSAHDNDQIPVTGSRPRGGDLWGKTSGVIGRLRRASNGLNVAF